MFTDDADGVRAAYLLEGESHRSFKIRNLLIVGVDEVSDDFRIGFRREMVPVLFELVLEGEIIFNYAIVHHDNAIGTVGVSIGLRGASVSSPAGMADAAAALHRLRSQYIFQFGEFALGAADFNFFPAVYGGDTRGVIAAIFKPPQSVENDIRSILDTCIANNSTHIKTFVLKGC